MFIDCYKLQLKYPICLIRLKVMNHYQIIISHLNITMINSK